MTRRTRSSWAAFWASRKSAAARWKELWAAIQSRSAKKRSPSFSLDRPLEKASAASCEASTRSASIRASAAPSLVAPALRRAESLFETDAAEAMRVTGEASDLRDAVRRKENELEGFLTAGMGAEGGDVGGFGAVGSGARSLGGAAVATDAAGVTAAVRVDGSLPTAIMPTTSVTAAADTRTAQRVTCRGGVGGSASGDFRSAVGAEGAIGTGFTTGAVGSGAEGEDDFSTTDETGAGALSICSGGRGRF